MQSHHTFDSPAVLKKNNKCQARYVIEEKIDGSQLSFTASVEGIKFTCRNKDAIIDGNTFKKACDMITFLHQTNVDLFNPNYTYHGESVCKPKHNICQYDRVPKYYFIIYDIFDNDPTKQSYLSREEVELEAKRVGFSVVPVLASGEGNAYPEAGRLIQQIEQGDLISCLGGRVEGVVVKYQGVKVIQGRALKLVSSAFKESKGVVELGKQDTEANDFLQQVGTLFAQEARLHKGLQHLREEGFVFPDPSDTEATKKAYTKYIGELDSDFDKEYKQLVMNWLWTEFSPVIKKVARTGSYEYFNAHLPSTQE